MALPRRLPKREKRDSRWRSPAHTKFVREHACCVCRSTTAIEAAHIRLGSGTGMGQRPHDWLTVSLCKLCHATQHRVGEESFWTAAKIDPVALAAEFAAASPKRAEIALAQRSRALAFVGEE